MRKRNVAYVAIVPLVALLVQCVGTETIVSSAGKYKTLPPVKGVGDGNGNGGGNGIPDSNGDPELASSVCEYWNGLEVRAEDGPLFQLFDQLTTQTTNNVRSIVGRQSLQRLPQVRYRLSGEYATSLIGIGGVVITTPACVEPAASPGKSPLDPPSVDEFMAMAKAQNDCGKLSDFEYGALKTIYDCARVWPKSGSCERQLLDLRNTKFMDAVEAQLPGIFRGMNGALTESVLMKDFMASAALTSLDPTRISELAPLARPVNLFPGKGWNARRLDLRQEMYLLAKTAATKDLALQEQACRFAVLHRVQAQLLTLKGMGNTPTLLDNGLAPQPPQIDLTETPKNDEPGTFGVVVNEAWILSQLQNPSARAEDAASTWDFMQSLRFFAAWVNHRVPAMWTMKDSLGNVPPLDAGTVRVDQQLLKLGVGFFGVTASLFKAQELQVNPDRSVHMREDSADNIGILGRFAMEGIDAFQSLSTPNALELQLLSSEQIASFAGPGGLVENLNLLISGVVLEGLGRVNKGTASEELKAVLRKIGVRIGNDRLKNIE